MLAVVESCWVHGIEGRRVRVEVKAQAGIPTFTIVGLPSAAVRESRDRVLAAISEVMRPTPARKVTVNLAPADISKATSGLDLPIAVGLLVALGAVHQSAVEGLAFAGELGLDASVRAIRGAVALAMCCSYEGIPAIVVPAENGTEAAAVPGVRALGAHSLGQVLDHLRGTGTLVEADAATPGPSSTPDVRLEDVRGQASAKRAVLIAAAGGHNLLMTGPPGAGKTMLARRLPRLLPPLAPSESLEVTRVHSVAGLGRPGGPVSVAPFRAPHHSISYAGMIGGGTPPGPGEVSLAHRGVLFLDELPEFQRAVLETLRQPLESGSVRVTRAGHAVELPARFQLVAAMNPCPCGIGDDGCTCSAAEVRRYRGRLSGPLLDRVDLHVHVRPPTWDELMGGVATEALSTAGARALVRQARSRQAVRSGSMGAPGLNGVVPARDLLVGVQPTSEATKVLEGAARRFRFSARAIHRVLRVSRTIADLEGRRRVGRDDVAEALQFRVPASRAEP